MNKTEGLTGGIIMIRKWVVWFSICCLFGICKASETNLQLVNLIEQIYIEMPLNVSLVKEFPVEDFMLVNFFKEGESFLRAYVGNAPKFPSAACSGTTANLLINSLPSKESICQDEELSSEVLVGLGKQHRWPQYIHFMLQRSTKNETAGRKIIYSITVK